MSQTIYDKILSGELKSWKVWEDDNYLAFLTPFPNTPGMTIVIPKVNIGDYIFELDEAAYQGLLKAVRTVAKLLEKAFKTPRVAMIFEGTGVAHVHAKLFPLHGELADKTNIWSTEIEFHEDYPGWLTTAEGPQMDDVELTKIQQKIIEAAT